MKSNTRSTKKASKIRVKSNLFRFIINSGGPTLFKCYAFMRQKVALSNLMYTLKPNEKRKNS